MPLVFYLKSHCQPRSLRFSPRLFSRRFIILNSTFVNTPHDPLWVNVCEVYKDTVSTCFFFFLNFYVDVQQFYHHLLKRLSLLHCIVFALLSKISWPYWCRSISEFSILFHWSLLFCHLYHAASTSVALLKLKYFLEVGEYQFSNFVLLL